MVESKVTYKRIAIAWMQMKANSLILCDLRCLSTNASAILMPWIRHDTVWWSRVSLRHPFQIWYWMTCMIPDQTILWKPFDWFFRFFTCREGFFCGYIFWCLIKKISFVLKFAWSNILACLKQWCIQIILSFLPRKDRILFNS